MDVVLIYWLINQRLPITQYPTRTCTFEETMKVFNITVLFFSITIADAFSTSNKAARQSSELCAKSGNVNTINRRSILATAFGAALGVGMSFPEDAAAAQADCMSDCLKNCKLIAPKVRAM
jgi:hypothetical protein